MKSESVFGQLGVEIKLAKPDDFLKIRETLSRIGIASNKTKKLYQSCHILHKRGDYAIMHFKELFLLDGKEADFSDDDRGRRNCIANLLSEWGLVKLVNPDQIKEPMASVRTIKILPYSEKNEWELVTKYTIGRKKKEEHV